MIVSSGGYVKEETLYFEGQNVLRVCVLLTQSEGHTHTPGPARRQLVSDHSSSCSAADHTSDGSLIDYW